ncbi:hypothetical protein EXIGLDRAFT_744877 [Exidia glandulosa HHB12029]|uniref:DUF6535 domain-containing protein n=1 Tax=Exidia glandulosa HHB12029 TaxID=1314781 RepID=A0A165P816_EXIGL|nr:hypothetical protein EXIGLDRAFT_744877 [Exidia glandulosa HHB12029]
MRKDALVRGITVGHARMLRGALNVIVAQEGTDALRSFVGRVFDPGQAKEPFAWKGNFTSKISVNVAKNWSSWYEDKTGPNSEPEEIAHSTPHHDMDLGWAPRMDLANLYWNAQMQFSTGPYYTGPMERWTSASKQRPVAGWPLTAMPDDVQDQDVLQDNLRDPIEGIGNKNDRFGFEMDDDAPVWRVYARAAQKRDSERLTQWNSSLDTLLIFAGLFSAVSTTFIIESYKQMQPDYTELMFRALVANTSGKEFVQQPFHVTESSRAVNCLWISSLIISLSTALIAILAKQWIAAYPVPIRDNLREWAQLRQFRMDIISPYLSTSLKARIRAEIPIAARAYLHEEQARYLRVAFHFGHDKMAVPLVNCVERWMYHDSGIRRRYADTIVRANCPILESTAHLVVRWFTENWTHRFQYFGIDHSYYPRILVLINAWRSHFEEDPSAIVTLLDSILNNPERRIVPHHHPTLCAGDPRYCRLIDQIAAILEQHQFTTGRGDDVERTLKMQTFETFMFFWKLHGYSEDAAHPSVHIWLSNEDALSGISIHGEHVLPLLYSIRPRSLPTRAHFALLFRLLDPTNTWHSAVSDDPLQPHALDQCLYLVDHFVFGGSENRRLALSLIDSGRLEPLSRAPSWNAKCLFLNMTETLATMATTAVNGNLTLMIPSEAPNDHALLVDKLVSSFIHADAECGPAGEIIISSTWRAQAQTPLLHGTCADFVLLSAVYRSTVRTDHAGNKFPHESLNDTTCQTVMAHHADQVVVPT